MITKTDQISLVPQMVLESSAVSTSGRQKIPALGKSVENSEHYFVSLSAKGTPDSSRSRDQQDVDGVDQVPTPFISSS